MKKNKVTFLLLIISQFSLITCCSLFETKRTCECSATFISNDNINRRVLFEIPSYDDCGIDLGCNFIECKKKCTNKIREILGGNENFINTNARNKVCELISPTNEPKSKIYVWASWKYSNCNSGDELLVDDMCCNKKCKCGIVSQMVSPNLNESIQNLIVDKTSELPRKDKSFDCSLRLQDECQTDCMNSLSNHFNEPLIKNPNKNVLNYNIFFKEYASNKICNTLNMHVEKPGVDIYAKIDTKENNNLIKYISLGRVCCQSQCKCEIIFKDGANGTVQNSKTITVNTTVLTFGYECSDELSNCIALCRKRGIEFATRINSTLDKNQTTLDLDILRVMGFRKDLCDKLNVINDNIAGYNVYLRYSIGKKSFPYTEDLHLGRFCCKFSLNSYIGLNRCENTNQ